MYKKKYIPLSQPSLINTLNVVYALWIFFFYFLTSSLIFTMHVHTLHTAQPSKQSFLQNLYSYIPFAIISLAFFCTLSSHRLDSVHYYLTKRKKSFCVFHFLRRLLEIPFVNFDIKEKRYFVSVWCVFVFSLLSSPTFISSLRFCKLFYFVYFGKFQT